MIRFQRTARISRGKLLEAFQWAKEVSEYLGNKYPQILTIGAYQEIFGDVSAIHWFADYKDLATLESANTQLQSDEGYWARIGKANEAGLFIEGSVHDKLVQSL